MVGSQVLLPSFTRAVNDNFPPARIAALMSPPSPHIFDQKWKCPLSLSLSLSLSLETLNPKPSNRNPTPQILDQKPCTLNPEPSTPNPEPPTLNTQP